MRPESVSMEPATMHKSATSSTGSCPSRASLRAKQQRKLHLRLLWRKKSVVHRRRRTYPTKQLKELDRAFEATCSFPMRSRDEQRRRVGATTMTMWPVCHASKLVHS